MYSIDIGIHTFFSLFHFISLLSSLLAVYCQLELRMEKYLYICGVCVCKTTRNNTKGNTLVSLRPSQSTYHKTLNILFFFRSVHSFIHIFMPFINIIVSIVQTKAKNAMGLDHTIFYLYFLFCFALI